MKFIKTLDGSYTVFNNKIGEHYHSISGAYEEALEKHVKAIGIEDEMKILDFCFGLGYNSIVATKNKKKLEITGLEIDKEILKAIKLVKVPPEIEEEFNNFREIYKKNEIIDKRNNCIKILLGDAVKMIKTLPADYFDRIFFDPFSPSKQPELWTMHVFEDIFRVMKSGAKLTTYSCAKSIRQNMKNAGLEVFDGPIVGRKAPSTIAIKS